MYIKNEDKETAVIWLRFNDESNKFNSNQFDSCLRSAYRRELFVVDGYFEWQNSISYNLCNSSAFKKIIAYKPNYLITYSLNTLTRNSEYLSAIHELLKQHNIKLLFGEENLNLIKTSFLINLYNTGHI